jgi:hypothetical protein
MKNVFRFWFDAIDRNGKSIQHIPATIEAEDLGHAMQKVSALLPDVTCAINIRLATSHKSKYAKMMNGRREELQTRAVKRRAK